MSLRAKQHCVAGNILSASYGLRGSDLSRVDFPSKAKSIGQLAFSVAEKTCIPQGLKELPGYDCSQLISERHRAITEFCLPHLHNPSTFEFPKRRHLPTLQEQIKRLSPQQTLLVLSVEISFHDTSHTSLASSPNLTSRNKRSNMNNIRTGNGNAEYT
jgi:hypothetical protein